MAWTVMRESPSTNAPMAIRMIRQREQRASVTSSSGGRFQEILANVFGQQSEDQVRIQPTQAPRRGAGWYSINPRQGLHPFKGEFDLPPQPVDGEDFLGRDLRRQ